MRPPTRHPAGSRVLPARRAVALRNGGPAERLDPLKHGEEIKRARDYADAIVQAVPPLLVLDPDLRVVSANASFYKHFRASPPQTENCLVYDLGNGQWNIPRLRTFLEEVLPKNNFFKDFEVTHQFESIGRRTILLSGHRVDHLELILLVIDDVTEQRESRAALRTSEIRYRRLFEAARDGILILDPKTRKITDANPFMTELLGYPHDELLGKELWEIGLLKDEKASRAAFRELQAKHFIRYENLPLQNQAGQRHEVEFVSNLYDEDSRKVIQCNIRDITQRKHAEDALRQAKELLANHAADLERLVGERTARLKETIGELEAFSYSVSHDMRAPLRSMSGYAQMVAQEYAGQPLDAAGLDYLQRIGRAAMRLDRLIQDVLSYTKVQRTEAPMASLDLDRLARDIIETYPASQARGAEIQIEGTLPPVRGNEAFLTQSISNLLGNAVKFVSPDTTPLVRIWAETKGEQVRVWFEDNGIGIARENHARIFRIFEHIHPTADYEGTGMGLAIARKAVERMGGHIGLESHLGKGSKFWIQLAKG